MALKLSAKGLLALSIAAAVSTTAVAQRKIEEVVVTAEKKEATVSDTSISITAFTAKNIEELGIQSADEMINYIPATTRDTYDVRVRGVGRNFRALGGDPGVATYYNGVYSPDFGIASSESGLYDLDRVEVLRGPQGTLYGRNSIGGAVNYVTKKPTYDFQGEVRAQVGEFNTQEVYGMLSGPIIDDTLAARLVVSQRDRDGWQENPGGEDGDSTDDRNVALSLNWQATDDLEINTRWNDRLSDRVIGSQVFITEGTGPTRDVRSTGEAVLGLREVAAGTPGAWSYTNPTTGEVKWALNRRAGIDRNASPHFPNPAYNQPQLAGQIGSKTDPNNYFPANSETGGDCYNHDFTFSSCNSERFEHMSGHIDATWTLNDSTSVAFIYGHTEFDYSFNRGIDYSDADFIKQRETVLESVKSDSYELQIHWGIGDNWTATSGIYYYDEARSQDYSNGSTTERFTQQYNDPFTAAFLAPSAPDFADIANGTSFVTQRGRANPRGDSYYISNTNATKSKAVYSQGTYEFNEEFALTVGLRWAEDEKTVLERRRLLFEENPTPDSFLAGVGTAMLGIAGLPGYDEAYGITELSLYNVLTGRASFTPDATSPYGINGITPTCAIDDGSCQNYLLLGGIPLAQTLKTGDSDSWDDVNYRVNLDWTPTDDILMYFSVTTGYRAGGYALGVIDGRVATGATTIGAPLNYDKETVISYEVGYKGLHLDETLQLSASLYRYEYDGYQDRVRSINPVTGGTLDIVENASGVTNMGFEVEAMWFPTDELSLGGNYSYTDTEYTESYLVGLENNPDTPISLFGGTSGPNPELYQVDAKGSELKRIPKDKATLWAAYEWITDFGPITWRATYSYTGDMIANGLKNDLDIVPSRFRVDTSIAWTSNDDKWSARLFVDNATDENSLRGVTSGNEGNNYRLTGEYLYPRYYGLDVTYRFGEI